MNAKYFVNYVSNAGIDFEGTDWNGWYAGCYDQDSASEILRDAWDSQTARTKDGFYGPFTSEQDAIDFVKTELQAEVAN